MRGVYAWMRAGIHQPSPRYRGHTPAILRAGFSWFDAFISKPAHETWSPWLGIHGVRVSGRDDVEHCKQYSRGILSKSILSILLDSLYSCLVLDSYGSLDFVSKVIAGPHHACVPPSFSVRSTSAFSAPARGSYSTTACVVGSKTTSRW